MKKIFRFPYAQNTRSEIKKSGSKVEFETPEFHKTRVRTKYYELRKEKIAQLSDESYSVDSIDLEPKKQTVVSQLPTNGPSKKKPFEYKCGGPSDPVGEMCCYKITPLTVEESHADDIFNEDLKDDGPRKAPTDKFCHRTSKDPPKSAARVRKPRGIVTFMFFRDGIPAISCQMQCKNQ